MTMFKIKFQVWFKNRRAKWRKRERNQINEMRNTPFGFPMIQYDPSQYGSDYYSGWGKMPLAHTTNPLGSMGKSPLSFPWSMASPTSPTVNANSFPAQPTFPLNSSMAALNSSAFAVQTSTAQAAASWDKLSSPSSMTGLAPLPTTQGTSTSPYATSQTSPYTAAAMYR